MPIPGTKRRRYLEENVAATEIELTEDEVEQIASALAGALGPAVRGGDDALGRALGR